MPNDGVHNIRGPSYFSIEIESLSKMKTQQNICFSDLNYHVTFKIFIAGQAYAKSNKKYESVQQ